jgi:hypothetical protein
LEAFDFGWVIKIERAERFVFLQAHMRTNRSKFSEERGEGTWRLSAFIFKVLDSSYESELGITFRMKDNSWTEPLSLGSLINSLLGAL